MVSYGKAEAPCLRPGVPAWQPQRRAQSAAVVRQPRLPEVRGVCGRCCPSFGLWEGAVGQPGVPWPGWGCLSPGRCPQLPRPPMCELRGAAADRSSVSLVTAGSRYSGKEAGSARKGRQVWGETALRGARASPSPSTVSELPGLRFPGVRPVPRSPDRRNAVRPRPGLESARKGCSVGPGGIQPAPRGERSSDLRRCELPSLPRC